MVARPATPVRSANAGEFGPGVAGRVDIKQYYSAGLAFKNIEPVPQGGFRQMAGSWRIGKFRPQLANLAITAPSTAVGTINGTVVLWSGTVAGPVAAVLVSNLGISAGTATFVVEAHVDGIWSQIAGPFAFSSAATVTRLAAYAPRMQKTADQIRVVGTLSAPATLTGISVNAYSESGQVHFPRYLSLTTDEGEVISCFVTAGIADFWTASGFKGSARLDNVTADMLPNLDFYAEARTIGIAHSWLPTARLFLATASNLHDWRADLWPYDPVPKADLGGVYTKTNDVWDIIVRWSQDVQLQMTVTVNGETTESVAHKDGAGNVITSNNFTATTWGLFATALQTAIRALPGVGPDLIVTHFDSVGKSHRLALTFAGSLAGSQYQVSALVVNTSDMSALPYHVTKGTTDFEPLFSTYRGWPGTISLVQDRMSYARIPAATGALALSKIGEYFDLDTTATTDNAARLDRLRTVTSETVLSVKESNYTFAFTDRGTYFVSNRTIERNTPLNFVKCSEIGIQPNCRPFELEGGLHYVAIAETGLQSYASGGNQLLRLDESAVTSSTSFAANPVSLLASHLVSGVIRSVRQNAQNDLDASKGWLMRADGRLVCGQFIRNQEITGFCEWIAASAGRVREVGLDGRNRLWLGVDRNGEGTIELYDSEIFLQDSVTASTDLAGRIANVPYENGAQLWAVADGYVLGPFTVADSKIELGDHYTSVLIGRWQAPRFETMPQVYVTPSDDIVNRPGRIHTIEANIIDTTSIAIGANGEPAEDVPLGEIGDPTNQPVPPKTRLLTVAGLKGMKTGTTAVITQLRPGALQVRDISIGAKL